MRRDMNIVRQIVKQIGDSEEKSFEGEFAFDEPVTKDKLHYHLNIMLDAGIIEGTLRVMDDGDLLFYSLLLGWEGNDFYETFKSDNIWNKTKKVLKNKGMDVANFPMDILLELGKKQLTELFE